MPIYRYIIKPMGTLITIEAPTSNTTSSIAYSGSRVNLTRSRLDGAYGAFGHLFDPDNSTPTDLDAALNSTFGKENVQRIGAAPSYDPGIPEGTIT